mmetsp:Transcript_61980/g.134348  ORF Transcript_61980/g.134348 Transcript_61980/m.134348 type:complete len:301 (-) Transcript_61980:131-1033(-)|eukprot:CAMPEP_0170629130 /NCGR_PEP_ID=MMETSP0224-20130122/33139_1 /TAXON_ID=285029 /ORGANISM="Togula jolla, Strain CCCM 725" /LENGTH=300 /DNA_ID=CAMNT_0010956773 /DNA_START=20 /DNA_END=922 /DNA_ORIENTATION=+
MEKSEVSPALASLLQASAGAASGSFAALMLHPLELVKTRIQTGRSKASLLITLRKILRNEGPSALYRGVGAQCCEEAMENFIFFYLYSSGIRLTKQRRKITTGINLLLGYLAGVGTTTMGMPVEVISTKLQVSRKNDGVIAVVARVLREDGLQGFFMGFWFNIILCANPAIQNTTFDKLKLRILKAKRGGDPLRNVALTPLEAFALGAGAKAIALTLCYPLVRMKVAAQAGRLDLSVWELDENQTRLQQLRDLYRGLGTALTKSVISAALMYMMKDQISRLVQSALLRALRAIRQRQLLA